MMGKRDGFEEMEGVLITGRGGLTPSAKACCAHPSSRGWISSSKLGEGSKGPMTESIDHAPNEAKVHSDV